MWLVVPLLYEMFAYIYPKIQHLNNLTYYYLFIYLFVFLIVSCVIVGKKKKYSFSKLHNSPKILDVSINIMYGFVLLCNVLLIIRFFVYTGTISFFDVITKFRVLTTTSGVVIPRDMKLLMYFFSLTLPLLMYTIIYKPQINPLFKYALIFELLVITFFYCNKTRMIKYIVAFILLFYFNKGEIKRKHYLTAFIVGGGAILSLIFIRDTQFLSNNSLFDYLFLYSLSPLGAFDSLIQGVTIPQSGFIRVQGPNGIIPTNVFTCLGYYYIHRGVIGILIYAVLSSLLFSVLYKHLNNRKYLFVYILTVYCLFFSFFADFCFPFWSPVVQDIIAVIIIFHFAQKSPTHQIEA